MKFATNEVKAIAKQADVVELAKSQKRKGKVARVQSNKVADAVLVKSEAELALKVWTKVQRAEGTLFNHHVTLGNHLKVIRDQYLSNNDYNSALKELKLDKIDASVRSWCLYVATNISDIESLQAEGKLPKSKSVQVLYKAHRKLKSDKPAKAEAKADAKPKAEAKASKADGPKAKADDQPKAVKLTEQDVADMILNLLKQNPKLDWETIADLVEKA